MVNIIQDLSLLRVLSFFLFLTCNVANSSTNSISNNVLTKCDRRAYYAVQSSSECDARQGFDATTRGFDATTRASYETVNEDMRLPRIDPVQVSMVS